MSELTIYKASAGSGKTFRLVVEYLKLLVQNPYAYKNTLAVTFTNKATAEMKDRIIRDLYVLGKGENKNLLELIVAETSLSSEKIIENAKKSLALILHDYDRFSISTIDSFFQRVLRSFARESGLHGTYEVELDQDAVLSEACDRLLMSIDTDMDLRLWLSEMTEDQLVDGKSWQIREKIILLGKELQKSSFQNFILTEPNIEDERAKLKVLKTEIVKYQKWFEAKLKEFGNNGLVLIKNHGLDLSDFSGGSRSFTNYLKYWANTRIDKIQPTATLLAAIDNCEKWYTKKSSKREAIENCFNAGLNQLFKDALLFIEKYSTEYNTASEISKFIYALGVLSTLAQKVRETGHEKNSLMLGEADLLLKGIIGDNDAPFIYEKAGSYFKNYMIDEFQDTSVAQWENFKPLIVNSLAENNHNMVVGDVKQSIYRWRNSNWQLLNKQIAYDLKLFGVNSVTLNANWRSSKTIVAFNNEFFKEARTILQEGFNSKLNDAAIDETLHQEFSTIIEQVFSDVEQVPKSTSEIGHVQFQSIESNDNAEYETTTVERVIHIIEKAQDEGFGAGDIAILVRTNKVGKVIADAIINHKKANPNTTYNFEVISDDALYIHTSPVIRFIIAMLRFFIEPYNEIVKAAAINEYATTILPEIKSTGVIPSRFVVEGQQLINFEREPAKYHFINNDVANEYFPFFNLKDYKAGSNFWTNRSLVDLINDLEIRYSLNAIKGEQANIQSLKDVVSEFVQREGGNIHKFMEWWNQFGNKIKLQTANHKNAIRIMTIHKSKGLEFPVVILPFCDWSLVPDGNKTNIIWCSTAKSKFNQFNILPVKYSERLKNTAFANDFLTEKLLSFVDVFNLLYVAFTRAIDGLYVITKHSEKDDADNLNSLFKSLIFSDNATSMLVKSNNNNEMETGKLVFKPKKVEEATCDVDLSISIPVKPILGDTLKLRNNYENFLTTEGRFRQVAINNGKLIHELLSNIENKSQTEVAVDLLIREGKIDKNEKESIIAQLKTFFDHHVGSKWFNGTYKVYNEKSIIVPAQGLYRPDRIMIDDEGVVVVDYKLSAEINSKHKNQVKGYVDKIKQMGYTNVEGWVWYLKLNELRNINDF